MLAVLKDQMLFCIFKLNGIFGAMLYFKDQNRVIWRQVRWGWRRKSTDVVKTSADQTASERQALTGWQFACLALLDCSRSVTYAHTPHLILKYSRSVGECVHITASKVAKKFAG